MQPNPCCNIAKYRTFTTALYNAQAPRGSFIREDGALRPARCNRLGLRNYDHDSFNEAQITQYATEDASSSYISFPSTRWIREDFDRSRNITHKSRMFRKNASLLFPTFITLRKKVYKLIASIRLRFFTNTYKDKFLERREMISSLKWFEQMLD